MDSAPNSSIAIVREKIKEFSKENNITSKIISKKRIGRPSIRCLECE